MSPRSKTTYWMIRGYDSTKKIYERKIGLGQITEGQLHELLKALTAKAGLTNDEIVGAYAKKGKKICNHLLEVRRDGPYPTFMCGSNPHFIACVVDQDLKPF